jgi:hypothetical protein
MTGGEKLTRPSVLHVLSEEEEKLETLLDMQPYDYLCHRLLYTTLDGERALATILRDASGHMEVRRVLPGRLDIAFDLRNWLEVDVFLDLGYTASRWMRDPDEENKRRAADRMRFAPHD